METTNEKALTLIQLTTNFIYYEHYSHTDCIMWKIDNEFTHYSKDKIVLCSVCEGIDKALDIAIKSISKLKEEFFN